ncbi:unnamed protein product [Diamesa hyperborea]
MSSKTINSLPKEMLLQIFCYLGTPTDNYGGSYNLKNASLVCKEWRTIIFNSIATMKHLSLNISEEWIERNEELILMNHKFYKINVSNLTVWNGLHDVFLQHGEHVRVLNISDCSMLSTDFTNIVLGLPMLESISFERVQLKENMPNNSVFTSFTNLKSIALIASNFLILKYFMKSRPQTLKICSASKNDNEQHFLEFLLNHDTLEDLALHKFKMEFFCCIIPEIYKNLPINLKKLSIHVSDCSTDVPIKDDCLMHIIEGQASFIRELEIDERFIKSVVFNSIRNLKTLYLNIDHTSNTAESLCLNLQPNKSIQSLLVTADILDNNFTSKLFALFPEVTTLGLISVSSEHVFPKEVLNTIAGCVQKVERLLLEKISNSNVILFKFPRLKTIEIKSLEDMSHSGWATFVQNNPMIESLMIENTYNFNNHCLSIIAMKLKNLKHLKLGSGFKLSMRSAKLIKKYCKNLKSLVVDKELLQDSFNFYDALKMKDVALTVSSKLHCAMFCKLPSWYYFDESSIDYTSEDQSTDSDSDMFDDYDDYDDSDIEEDYAIAGYYPG